MVQIAIIGSGPSGCYVADILAKKIPESQIDLFDRLPTPFGLVRAGVAPDHLHTKNITRQFERILSRENIRFIGNINLGTDLSYTELKQHYHIIVIASGAPLDNKLNIKGENLNGVYGAGEISRWYNGHPDSAQLNPHFSNAVAIIGNGNVALDIARILSKQHQQLINSDMPQRVLAHLDSACINDIYLIGRRSAADASFTPAELQELLSLPNIAAVIDSEQIPEQLPVHIEEGQRRNAEKNLSLLRALHTSTKPVTKASIPAWVDGKTRLHFINCASAVSINGRNNQVTTLHLVKNQLDGASATPTDEYICVNVDTVISAIGFQSLSIPDIPFDSAKGIFLHQQGKIESGVYATGWCKRGSHGVIPANRVDAVNLAKTIIADWEHTVLPPHKTGFSGISTLLENKNIKPVSYKDWLVIDQAEIKRATQSKPREKFTSITQMLTLVNKS
ncbi:FAD-dependent oxidoreductase [Neptunomonas sp.]|uniref:FAD-dependent oxidoreductase n=1 Tax=Neptunomonas sp. TaxID=1971898 RepID=UPI00356843B6